MDAVVAAQNFVGARGRGVKRGLHRVVVKIHRPFFKHDLIASLAACFPILSAERFSMASPVTPAGDAPIPPQKPLPCAACAYYTEPCHSQPMTSANLALKPSRPLMTRRNSCASTRSLRSGSPPPNLARVRV